MEITEIEGTIFTVSNPKIFSTGNVPSKYRSNISDYYHVIVKCDNNDRYTIYLPVSKMGILSVSNSVIETYNVKTKKWMYTSMVRPERYIGTKVRVKGYLKGEKYLTIIQSFRLLL